MSTNLLLGDDMLTTLEFYKNLLRSNPLDLLSQFRAEFKELEGREITVAAAEKKYELRSGAIARWIVAGDIRVIRPGVAGGTPTPAIISERDVAARAKLYKILPNAKLKIYRAKTA